MSKGKRLIVTLMSSGMATAMSFVVSFFLTPFITNMLGTEAYGFVTLSKNFVSYTYVINNQPNGTNINTNAGSTHIEGLQKFVVEKGLDVGFAFDGDADRCLCVDENRQCGRQQHRA